MHPSSSMIRLPFSLQRRLDAAACALLKPQNGRAIDFPRPPGEAALFAPDSLSWRIFKNPVALLIGGIAAVILELAEPALRTGFWEHSSFRKDPMGRLQRTGVAAIEPGFVARGVARSMRRMVDALHDE